MELQAYNESIARRVRDSEEAMIENLPQEEMFGGARPRKHPLPDMTFSPSTLAVGGARHHRLHGSGVFDTINSLASSPLGMKVLERVVDAGLKKVGLGHPHMAHHTRHAHGAGFLDSLKSIGSSAVSGIGSAISSPIGQKITDKAIDAAILAAMAGKRPRRGRKHGGAMVHHFGSYGMAHPHHAHGAGFLDSLKSVGSAIVNSPITSSIANKVVDKGVDALLTAALAGKRPRKSGCGGGARGARAQIVKQVMAQHGMSLPMASKFVKEHGLY